MSLTSLLLLAAQAASAAPLQLPNTPELEQAIIARDGELFATVFQECDPARLRTIVADDFEMYHDRAGVVARSAEAFVAQYTRDCSAHQEPGAWRSRRELVKASLIIEPVPGYGAIQHGEHLFYERQGNGPEKLAGRALFTQLWVLMPSGWRLARVLSFHHRPAE